MRLILFVVGFVTSECVDQALGNICLDACDKQLVECMLKSGYYMKIIDPPLSSQ